MSNAPPTRPHSSTHGREDEVGMALGKVIEVALAAMEEAFAENAARSDRDLRLG